MNARDYNFDNTPWDSPVEYTFDCKNPPKVIDRLRDMKQLRSDAQLCRLLQVTPPIISKIRTGRMKISAGLMIRIHEVYQLPFSELRGMLAEQ